MFLSSFKKASQLLSICAFVAFGFFAAQIAIVFIIRLFVQLKLIQASSLQKPLPQLLIVAVAYCLALAIIVWLPRLFSVQETKNIKTELGITKTPRLVDAGLSVAGYGVYLLLTIVFAFLVQAVWHGFNANQAQQVGFQGLSSGFEYFLAFVALVVVPPLVEESLFRGYLFGKLRAQSNFWLSALITSALFGLVHLQWNVGVDVFALSLVLCYLRERTGAIWAGVSLHMIKNGIAFVLLFLHPAILNNLL